MHAYQSLFDLKLFTLDFMFFGHNTLVWVMQTLLEFTQFHNHAIMITRILITCLAHICLSSYAGHQKAIYEKTLHLEDLLELQHLRDPVSFHTNKMSGLLLHTYFAFSSVTQCACLPPYCLMCACLKIIQIVAVD